MIQTMKRPLPKSSYEADRIRERLGDFNYEKSEAYAVLKMKKITKIEGLKALNALLIKRYPYIRRAGRDEFRKFGVYIMYYNEHINELKEILKKIIVADKNMNAATEEENRILREYTDEGEI